MISWFIRNKYLTCSLILFVLAIILISSEFTEVKSNPEIFGPEKSTISLGEIEQFSIQEVTFVFHNYLKNPVEILEVQGTCSCEIIDVDKKLLEPGVSTNISVRWSVLSRRGNQQMPIFVTWRQKD